MSKKPININQSFLSYIQILFLLLMVVFLIIINLINNHSNTKTTYVLSAQDNTQNQIYYWRDFLSEHPDYISGWIRLAELEYESGNKVEAQNAFWSAYDIDQNSLELNNLRIKLKL